MNLQVLSEDIVNLLFANETDSQNPYLLCEDRLSFNKTCKLFRSLNVPCCARRVLGKTLCKFHNKEEFYVRKKIHKRYTMALWNNHEFIHFDTLSEAKYAKQALGQILTTTCCSGLGYRIKNIEAKCLKSKSGMGSRIRKITS